MSQTLAIESVWGIDIALAHIAIGIDSPGRAKPFVQHFKVSRDFPSLPARLAGLRATVCTATARIRIAHPPRAVYVEQPSGVHRNQALVAAWGVICEALSATLADTPYPTPIWTIPSATWKAEVLGKGYGNAKKDLTTQRLREVFADTAHLNEHELDAMGIARFGRDEVFPGPALATPGRET